MNRIGVILFLLLLPVTYRGYADDRPAVPNVAANLFFSDDYLFARSLDDSGYYWLAIAEYTALCDSAIPFEQCAGHYGLAKIHARQGDQAACAAEFTKFLDASELADIVFDIAKADHLLLAENPQAEWATVQYFQPSREILVVTINTMYSGKAYQKVPKVALLYFLEYPELADRVSEAGQRVRMRLATSIFMLDQAEYEQITWLFKDHIPRDKLAEGIWEIIAGENGPYSKEAYALIAPCPTFQNRIAAVKEDDCRTKPDAMIDRLRGLLRAAPERLSPEDRLVYCAKAWYNLGLCYETKGKPFEAMLAFQQGTIRFANDYYKLRDNGTLTENQSKWILLNAVKWLECAEQYHAGQQNDLSRSALEEARVWNTHIPGIPTAKQE